MLDLWPTFGAVERDGDHVDPRRAVFEPMPVDVGRGELGDAPLLVEAHGLGRMSVGRVGSRPHLDEHHRAVVEGHDVDIAAQIAFHRAHGRLATVTAVQPPGRYGALQMDGDAVRGFAEKPRGDGGRINGGFFVLSPRVIDLIDGDQTSWEGGPLERLAAEGELKAWQHDGFWQPMDTLRDKTQLEELWQSGNAPWKVW